MEHKRRKILEALLKTLTNLSKEKPRNLYAELPRYLDDYYPDSLGGLSLIWEQSFKVDSQQDWQNNHHFQQDLPVASRLLTDLEKIDDGKERTVVEYATLLARVPAAISEVQKLLAEYEQKS